MLLSNLIDYATPLAKSELKQSVLLHPDQLASIVAKLEKISKSTVNTIEIASANFVAEDVKLNNTYSTDVRQRNVEVRRVDFSQPYLAARNANNWVSGKTHNLINEILNPSSVSPYTRLLLANTIYFKGMWKYTFIETNPGKFEASPNNPRQINKMFQLNKLRYGTLSFPDGNGLRWVELPYEGNRLAMLVFLPTVRHQLEASLRQLKPYDLAKVMAAMRTNYINTKVHLHMPKFTLTDSVSLIPALQRMGIHSIFQDQDALQYIANESTMVSDVTQRSYMSVDEFGTKATSVASLSIVTLSITPQFKDVQFDVDQPFLTMIVDKQERYPIFIGVINNPRE
ncbi:AAEL003697-PA [Aedes aegypti]|uniref:AAEL003697-PA n=1 Tax=Aedes aegypti TaxID=7159 RepID=Q17EW6_AEDAE|nr:AAEL003697-PA [Aedes aegypti]